MLWCVSLFLRACLLSLLFVCLLSLYMFLFFRRGICLSNSTRCRCHIDELMVFYVPLSIIALKSASYMQFTDGVNRSDRQTDRQTVYVLIFNDYERKRHCPLQKKTWLPVSSNKISDGAVNKTEERLSSINWLIILLQKFIASKSLTNDDPLYQFISNRTFQLKEHVLCWIPINSFEKWSISFWYM